MQALVLVGGEGTRLRPLTETIPKPVVPLCGRPFASYVVDWLARHGVDEVVLASGFKADRLREALGEGGDGGPRLSYVEESAPLGTAGAMKNAADVLEDHFLALNGDVLMDLDLSALIAKHGQSGARATIALHHVDDASAYGVVHHGDDGAVTEFLEKPGEDAGPGEVNAGAYVLERSVLDNVPDGVECSIEREVFPGLVGNGLFSLALEGYWMDIGTPDRYLQASWDILEGKVDTGRGGLARPLVAASAEVAGDATVAPRAVVGERCRIEAGAEVADSVLLDDCVVGEGAAVRGAILSPGTEVAAGASVDGRVSAERELIETTG